MVERLRCRRCEAELVQGQKVCPKCGEVTAAGGKYDIEEEPAWRPSTKMIKVAAALVVAIVLIAIVLRVTDRTTPEEVAEEWFGALSSRNVLSAERYVTPKLVQTLGTRMMSLTTLSEDYVTELSINSSVPRFSKPSYQGSKRAEILLTFTHPDGSPGPEVRLVMVRIGGEWKIDQVL